jgi:hypothetical protein
LPFGEKNAYKLRKAGITVRLRARFPKLAPIINWRAVASKKRRRPGEETEGKSMKKLLIAAAVAAMAGGAFMVQGQAAPAQDPMCKMGTQATNQGWMDHYGCWKGPMVKPVAAKPSKKDPMCGMGVQATNQGWMDHYNCWGPVKHW